VYNYISSRFFPIKFIDDCIGEKVRSTVGCLLPGEVLLLENLRFYKGEEKTYPDFVQELASLLTFM